MKLTAHEKKFMKALAVIESRPENYTYGGLRDLSGLSHEQVTAAEASLLRRGLLRPVPTITAMGLAALKAA